MARICRWNAWKPIKKPVYQHKPKGEMLIHEMQIKVLKQKSLNICTPTV